METKITKCVLCERPIYTGAFIRCAHCGLTQTSPMKTKKELAALYHEDFDHFTPYLAQIEVHRKYFARIVSDIKKKFPGNKKWELLDIGCAMGVLLEEARKEGMDAWGVDISRDAVAVCRKKGLRASVGWPDKTFDVITAFQVIEHESDPVGFLKNVKKHLKKGGLLVVATPDTGGWGRKLMGKYWVGFGHPEHVALFDFRSMEFALKKAGFSRIHIQPDDPRPFPFSFVFTRSADYFPALSFILRPIGKLLDTLNIKNPLNPWNDMIAYGKT